MLSLTFYMQDNVFQCTLPQEFRDQTCNNADLVLNYIDSYINASSVELGRPLII